MYTKDEMGKLKIDLLDNIQEWANYKIDALVTSRPKLKLASTYLKRGVRNWVAKETGRINNTIDNVLLFVADENGNVNTDILINDLVEMFKAMDVQNIKMGVFDIEYGKGEVKINIPHNPILDMLMGDLGQVKIATEDILEIKELFKSN